MPVKTLLAALSALMLTHCASSGPGDTPPEDWRLIPESTVLGERRQFFVYGFGLDSARIEAPPSVKVEKGWSKPDRKVLSLYLKVDRINDDSTLLGENPGERRITVKTPDTSVTLYLKILGEAAR